MARPRMAARCLVAMCVGGCGPRVEDGNAGATSDGPPGASSTTDDAPVRADLGVTVSTGTVGTDGGSSTGSDASSGTGSPQPECPGDALSSDVFDPATVYIVGTVAEEPCPLPALAHWMSPDDAVAGFDCGLDNTRMRIEPDGRLIYIVRLTHVLREFRCDACPIDDVGDYPADPTANDIVLSAPGCVDGTVTLLHVLADPDGPYLVNCSGGLEPWSTGDGEAVYDGTHGWLLHLGYDDLALTELGVVRLSTNALAPVDPMVLESVVAIRADPRDGFFVARSEPLATELWHVSGDGETELLGEYPSEPEFLTIHDSVLDGCGALFERVLGTGAPDGGVIRRTLDGASELVYDASEDPRFALRVSGLVTGP